MNKLPPSKSFWQKNKKEIKIAFLVVVVFPLIYLFFSKLVSKDKASIEQNNNNGKIQNIDKQEVINYSDNDSGIVRAFGKMYFLKIVSIQPNKHTWEYTFGNPDNLIVKDANIILENENGFDTAYFVRPFKVDNGIFERSIIRDAYFNISPDKKRVVFTASYVGANTTVKIVTQTHGGQIKMSGVGKLF
ncbi:MAG TPA: hypothetical protein VKC90_01740 [Chitinophagaceae bacterium]|nr:hypothetical protein [Chitinophagaceae bacterium]